MAHAIIQWGDGFTAISPAVPEKMHKELRYWHRSIVYDHKTHKRIATGETRTLYHINPIIDANQAPAQELVTFPGFLHRIKSVLMEEGWTYEIRDTRTPILQPNIEAALPGLREYQMECAYVTLMSGGGIVAVPTGWGKTHIMAAIIRAYDSARLRDRGTPTTVVATPEKDITRKDYEDLKKLLPGRDVGLIMSGISRSSDDVQVITLDSLHHMDPDDVGLLIVDEVHTAATDTRTAAILSMRKAMRYGVSATPNGRFDGRDLTTEGLFGPVVYTRTYQQGIADGALVPIHICWLTAPPPDHGIDTFRRLVRRDSMYGHAVDNNTGQNKMIAEIISKTPDSKQLLCIMQHLSHMDRLAELTKIAYVHAESSAVEISDRGFTHIRAVSRQMRNDTYDAMAAGTMRKVMSTYVYKQGVNFPELQVIINAGGGGSDIVARQIPGRESRNIGGEKQESYLVDFWHPWDIVTDENGKTKPGLVLRDDISRCNSYEELGFDQVWLDSIQSLPFLRQQ